MKFTTTGVLILIACLAGCEATPLQSDFGNAVRAMRAAQAYDQQALANPSSAPVEGADGDMVKAGIEAMRKDTAPRQQVKRDIVINVGGGQ